MYVRKWFLRKEVLCIEKKLCIQWQTATRIKSAQGELKQLGSKRKIKAEEQRYHFSKYNLQHPDCKSEKKPMITLIWHSLGNKQAIISANTSIQQPWLLNHIILITLSNLWPSLSDQPLFCFSLNYTYLQKNFLNGPKCIMPCSLRCINTLIEH